MVYFVGAGPGAEDLITVRGMRLLGKADVIIYAGSLVNPKILDYAGESCEIYNSAKMTLDEIVEVIIGAERKGKNTVRLHTGEPSVFGAVREQMDELDRLGVKYESCPGVTACFGAAASLNMEYTLPGVSQSLIITRMEGRTDVPESESIESFANEDLKKTKEVIAYDDVIDDMFSQVKKELADGILNGEATQEQILDILMIAKYYERIGDHATNIAEWAEYAITGVHRNSELEEHL